MAVDPLGVPLAVVAQQGHIAGALLGDQYVAVGQYEQPPRIDETRHERRRVEARRHLQFLPVKGHDQRPVGDDRPVFGGGRSLGSMWKRRPISCSAWKFCASSSFVAEPCPGAACCCAEADDSASTAAAPAARAIDEMREFIAISLSNRVPARTPSVSAIEPLSKSRWADRSNVTARRRLSQTRKREAHLFRRCTESNAVADIAVKCSQRTASDPINLTEILAFCPPNREITAKPAADPGCSSL